MIKKSIDELNKEYEIDYAKEDRIFEDALVEIMAELRKFRSNHKLTQGELAKKINCSQAFISQLENGEKNPSIKSLAKIVAALNGHFSISLGINSKTTDFSHQKNKSILII